jgi:hypothetical protein
MPKRIQRKRSAGWGLSPGTIYVGRPSKWANPFTIKQAEEAGYRDPGGTVVHAFRRWLAGDPDFATWDPGARQRILDSLPELRGKDLCCWCHPRTVTPTCFWN